MKFLFVRLTLEHIVEDIFGEKYIKREKGDFEKKKLQSISGNLP